MNRLANFWSWVERIVVGAALSCPSPTPPPVFVPFGNGRELDFHINEEGWQVFAFCACCPSPTPPPGGRG